MAKFGSVVKFDPGEGEDQLAFVLKDKGDTKLDLLAFNSGGTGSVKKDVPLRAEGGGHTYKHV